MALFHRERKNLSSNVKKSLKDLTKIINPEILLAEEKRQNLISKIRELCEFEDPRFESLCLHLIHSLGSYCQSLPETLNSYYSQVGGLIDYTLNRTEAALSLLKEYLIPDENGTFSEEQKLWQYALFSAAILQGIGKLFVDFKVSLHDDKGLYLKDWNPLIEPMEHTANYYSYTFKNEPEATFRRRLNLLLAKTLMPVSGFQWIAENERVLAVWLAMLNEDERTAGTLGAILIRADSLAIQRYLTELMLKHSSQQGGGRFAHIGTFIIGSGAPESLIEKEQLVGFDFIQWTITSLDSGKIKLNEAPLFFVPGGLLMCNEMFQLFVREHPEYKNWEAVKKGLDSLNILIKNKGTINSRFEDKTNKTMHEGVVLNKFALVLPPEVKLKSAAGHFETVSALELLHQAQSDSHLIQQESKTPVIPIQKLNAVGQWQNSNEITSRPGTDFSG